MENQALTLSPHSLNTPLTAQIYPQEQPAQEQPVLSNIQPVPWTPSNRPPRIALLGGGRWGTHLLRNFLALTEVIAVVDPFEERLSQLQQKYQLDSQVLLTPEWEKALALPGLEAVAIATPATTHYSLIKAALQRGLHVLAEKPLTLEPAESWELCRLAETQQRQLVIDHTYLFHAAVQRGKTALQQQLLGGLRYGYADRTHLGPVRQDVDVLWDLAIHDIAIFNYWLNATPIQVQAQGRVWLQDQANPPQFPEGLSDLVWVRLTYANGFQAMIHLCWSNPDKQRRLCLVGDRGTLIFDELQTHSPLTFQQGRLEKIDQQYFPVEQQEQILDLPLTEPLQEVCRHFLDCARLNLPSEISPGWLGAELVKVLAALTRSLNQNGAVIDLAS